MMTVVYLARLWCNAIVVHRSTEDSRRDHAVAGRDVQICEAVPFSHRH